MRSLHVAFVAALLPLVAACGGDKDDVPSVRDSLPACDSVWVAGETLPEDYDGKCVDSDDSLQVSEIQQCTESDEKFTTYDDSFFALLGGEISDASFSSGDYSNVFFACFGTDR